MTVQRAVVTLMETIDMSVAEVAARQSLQEMGFGALVAHTDRDGTAQVSGVKEVVGLPPATPVRKKIIIEAEVVITEREV